jgi:hypothetical protein
MARFQSGPFCLGQVCVRVSLCSSELDQSANDDHIDTALRSIVGELCRVETSDLDCRTPAP